MVMSQLNSTDIRDQYIARVVQGKTFAEVGGLWGTVNEKISIAHRCDASALTMIDSAPLESEGYLWQAFDARMADLNITNYNCLLKDVCQLQTGDIGQPFDVVHCGGVLYHHPHPMQMLVSLRQITGQYLILTSAITQEVIENEKGRYQIPPSGVIFVPALNQQEVEILRAYWSQFCLVPLLGIEEKVTYRLDNFAPWWWLPTASALKAMCEVAGFEVLESELTWLGNALSLLLKVEPQIQEDRPDRIVPEVSLVQGDKERHELEFWKTLKLGETLALEVTDRNISTIWYKDFYTSQFGLDDIFYTDKKVLDIGCGPMGSLEWADMVSERVGLDPLADSYCSLRKLEHKMQYVNAHAEAIPFNDGYFDVVCSFNSLDHVDEIAPVIDEIIRVLAPGGSFLLITEVNHEPTPTEPISFSWDIVESFTPQLQLVEERHYEKSSFGVYQSIQPGIPFDHQNELWRCGILLAKFRKQDAEAIESYSKLDLI
jgi:SAM-dependent methyltransferase